MGCDIHPAIEVQEDPEHDSAYSWELVAQPDRTRNYEFFSLLAGVRGEFEPWVELRGLPKHLGWKTGRVYEDGIVTGIVNGEHSASWFTLEEARKFILPKEVSGLTVLQWLRWIRTMEFFAELYEVPPQCVRAVFNFDS